MADYCSVHVLACTLGYLSQEGFELSSALGQQVH